MPSRESRRGFCHACSRQVEARVNPTSQEAECIECEGTFVEFEEFSSETTNSSVNSTTTTETTLPQVPVFRRILPFMNRGDRGEQTNEQNVRGNRNVTNRAQRPRSSILRGMGSSSGASSGELVASAIRHMLSQAQHESEASTVVAGGDGVELLTALAPLLASGRSTTGSETIGDYAIGSLSNIIEQLVANDPGRLPSPPSKRAINQLCKTVEIQQKHIDDGWECGIFKEPFGIGQKAITLPCGHIFLDDAIHRWFKDHHSCPVCRHALPTEAEENRNNIANSTPPFTYAD